MADQDTLIARGPSLVRWGAVFSGAITAIAVFALLSALWVALAFENIGGGTPLQENTGGIADNLEWYLAGSGIFAMLLGGFMTGWFAGLRGSGVGGLNGFVTWAVTVFGTIVFGAPSVLGAFGIAGTGTNFGFNQLWAPFWTLAIGLVTAVVGGAIGGTMRRPNWLFEPQAVEVTELVSEPGGRTTMHARTIDLRPYAGTPTGTTTGASSRTGDGL